MTTIQITNVSPLGELDVPILGRVVPYGASVDVDSLIAGRTPEASVEGDLGEGLLAQVGVWALTLPNLKKSTPTPITADSTPPVKPEGA